MELDPLYADVAVRRWQAFTNKQATLLGDGRTFDAVAAERPPAAVQAEAADARRRGKKSKASGSAKASAKRAERKPESRC
jgi:hypothetical protein